MNISITTEGNVTHNGEEIARIIDGECLSLEKLGGVTKGAIRKTSGNPDLQFKIVSQFPLHGGGRDDSTGPVLPNETQRPALEKVTPLPSPVQSFKDVDGIRYVLVNDQSRTGWVGTNIMGVLKLPE